MQIKIFFIICFLINFYFNLFSQESQLSSPSQQENNLVVPLYFELYYKPNFDVLPEVEYEDVNLPYEHYISPEFEKDKLPTDFFTESLKKTNFFSSISLGNISSFLVKAKEINEKSIFGFSFSNESKQISFFNSLDKLSNYNYNFIYKKTFDSFVLGSDIEAKTILLNNSVEQYSVNILVNKIFKYFDFTYTPYAQLNKISEYNFKYLFLINNFSLNFVPYYKILCNLGIEYLHNRKKNLYFYKLTAVFKDFLIDHNKFELEAKYSDKNDFFYFVKLTQKLKDLLFNLQLGERFYYDYLKSYFIKFPILKLSENSSFIYPRNRICSFGLDFGKTLLDLKINYTKENYDKFPSYILNNDVVLPYYINDLDVENLYLFSQISFSDFSILKFNIRYGLNNKILFYPKVEYGLDVENKIKSFYFITKLIYKDKILVDNEDNVLKESLVFEFITKYKISDNLSVDFSSSYPLLGKNYICPNLILEPYLFLGVSFNF